MENHLNSLTSSLLTELIFFFGGGGGGGGLFIQIGEVDIVK